MPADKVFIDSTTFLYTLDRNEPAKGQIALDWLVELRRAQTGVTNLQALNEVVSVATRKTDRFGGNVFADVEAFAMFGVSPLTLDASLTAREVFLRYQYSWWDCILLASAIELGCSHFLWEDLQDGQRIVTGDGRGLTIVDPFAHSPDQILAS
jgi:predicted nucleic acid-binding protein